MYTGFVYIDCRCCGLKQRIKDRDGALPTLCDECGRHQGKLPEKRVARAECHEAMLRERLTACRLSESQAQSRARIAKSAAASALRSRGSMAVRVVNALGNPHMLQGLARDPQVRSWADRHERDDEYFEQDWSVGRS